MPKLITMPKSIEAVGNVPARVEEYIGRVNSGTYNVSVTRIISPKGWQEPGQTPRFQEIAFVLRGCLKVEHENGSIEVKAGQVVIEDPEEWVRHSAPYDEGVDYLAICIPAFSAENVQRDSA
jgi:quercetin dioxygenase-like cupin family protein